MKNYSIPEEPEEGTRVLGNQSRRLYTHSGGFYAPWRGEDGNEYEWVELLSDEDGVTELVAPVEAIRRLKAGGGQHMEDIKAVVEFAEAFV